MIARAQGYKCHVCIPENISQDKIDLLHMLGAIVTVCPCVPFTDPRSYMSRAAAITAATEGAVMPDQFENVANSEAHYTSTGPELWRQCHGALDGFVCAVGTGGTIGGVSRFLKGICPSLATYIIDPTGSGLKCFVETGTFSSFGSCFIDGIGISRKTANFGTAMVDGAFRGDDREAVEMAYYLLRNEGVFVGPSAALNVVGAVKLARKLGPGSTVATVLCDSGERYRATTFSAEWLRSKQLTPACAGTHLGFVKDEPSDRPPLHPAVQARLVGEVLDAMPKEWHGTTFRNAELLGRAGFASNLHDLIDRKAASPQGAEPAPIITTHELEGLGNAEDYLRVANNACTLLEALLARERGYDVRRLFAFASAHMPLVAVFLTLPAGTATLRLYTGNAPPLLTEAQCQMLAPLSSAALEMCPGEPPDGLGRSEGVAVLCLEACLPHSCASDSSSASGSASGSSSQRFAARVPACVDGTVGLSACGIGLLTITNPAKVSPDAILLMRKRLATPATTPVVLAELAKLAGRSTPSVPHPPEAASLDALGAHLQQLTGTDVDPETPPLLFSAGLSAVAALWLGLLDGGGADILMCATAYGGSSQVTDLLVARTPKLRKHTFNLHDAATAAVGDAKFMSAVIKESLSGLAKKHGSSSKKGGASAGTDGAYMRLPRLVLFIEAPTNPDMLCPDLSDLASTLMAHGKATGQQVLLVIDATLAPPAKVMSHANKAGAGALGSAPQNLPVITLLSLSKSISRGLTIAGALVANHTAEASAMLTRTRAAAAALGTAATADQQTVLVQQHEGVEARCERAYDVACWMGEQLVDAVREGTGVEMAVGMVDAADARRGFFAATISFNLPPPRGADADECATLAQRFVDALCADTARFKPCVSFGQDNGLVYCTVPATSTQGAVKAEDKDKQALGGVQLARLSFPPNLELDAARSSVLAAVERVYAGQAAAAE